MGVGTLSLSPVLPETQAATLTSSPMFAHMPISTDSGVPGANKNVPISQLQIPQC